MNRPAIFTTPNDDRLRMTRGDAPEGRVGTFGDHDVAAALAVQNVGRNCTHKHTIVISVSRLITPPPSSPRPVGH
jgi:hypothetical protein